VDKPLKSVPHGQCDARPTVTFPAAEHHRHVFFGWYHIVLLGDRGTWVLATCPELLPNGAMTKAICKHGNELRHFNGPRKKRAACAYIYIHKSFIKKMAERINLTMKKWTKCNQNKTH